MVTFDEAKSKVLSEARKTWHAGMGHLVIAPDGFESSTQWRIRAVAREELDGDPEFIQMDEPIYLVDKKTGDITITAYLIDRERIDAMAPVRG
jgi:hypothetical protein